MLLDKRMNGLKVGGAPEAKEKLHKYAGSIKGRIDDLGMSCDFAFSSVCHCHMIVSRCLHVSVEGVVKN